MRIKAASMYFFSCVLLVGLSINVPGQAHGGINTKSRESLRGLNAVALIVHTTPKAERDGITRARIYTEVKLKDGMHSSRRSMCG